MRRESEFAGARMRHSVWNEIYDDIMSIPVRSLRLKIKRQAAALIGADRAEIIMDNFITGCFKEMESETTA
ncbi:Uncharacterised protein [Yersinia mollaretii]|uniref:hypothetical protein n=1 Tax=Yersinia mollaretii TaxID=33060 RepID=UPI0005E7DD38|nr:hypothetical protein [Yersinia mollaretii]CNK69259.1 Uncharacterised protein [Yersinia mollaretii]